MLSSLQVDIFSQLIVSLKNTGTTMLLAITAYQLSLDGFGDYVAVLALDFDTSVS
jgi:hypothetical protein